MHCDTRGVHNTPRQPFIVAQTFEAAISVVFDAEQTIKPTADQIKTAAQLVVVGLNIAGASCEGPKVSSAVVFRIFVVINVLRMAN